MIYIEESYNDQIEIEGKWYYARPENYKYMTLFERIKDAWLVFVGKADAAIWGKGQ